MSDSALPRISWGPRLLALSVSLLLLGWLARHVDRVALRQAFSHLHPGWFFVAFLAMGAATFLAAMRWHRFLRLTRSVTHSAATLRSVIIGQAFNYLLFGGAGGDLVKGGFYSRWYRHPLPDVLASCVYDRSIGLLGSALMGVLVLVLALTGQAADVITKLRPPEIEYRWIVLVLAIAGALFWWLKRRSRGDGFVGQTATSMREAFRRLRERPRLLVEGMALSFLVQLLFASLLAINLQAVSPTPLPWGRILWVFPVISFLASVPMSISGAGVREGVGMVLLRPYGITSAQVLAAGVLTFIVYLLWILIGLFLFGREARRVAHTTSTRPIPRDISVVIPVLNEVDRLVETVRRARALPEVREVIVVVGDGEESAAKQAEELGCRVLSSLPGRGVQLRRGAEAATGDVVLLLHADTRLAANAGKVVLDALRDPTVVGGGYWKASSDGPRLLLFHRVPEEQGIFVRREVLVVAGGVPDQSTESELCRALRRHGRLALADATVSADVGRPI